MVLCCGPRCHVRFRICPARFYDFCRPDVVVIVTRLRAGQLGYRFYTGTSFSVPQKLSVSGAHPASSLTGTESFAPEANWPGYVADHSQPPSSAKIKK